MPEDSASRRDRGLPQIAYHTAAAAIVLVFARFLAGKAAWDFPSRAAILLLVTVGAYWLVAMGLLVRARGPHGVSGVARAAASLGAVALVLAAALLLGSSLPRVLTLWAPLLGFAFLVLGQCLHARLSWRLLAVPALLVATCLLTVVLAPDWLHARFAAKPVPTVSQFRIRSSLYDLTVTSFQNYLPATALPRGGLAQLGDRYLLASGDGQLILFRPATDMRSLDIQRLAYRVPMNADEFSAASANRFKHNAFRVGDVIVGQEGGERRVFVSHHYWHAAERCWSQRVSSLQGSLDQFLAPQPVLDWKTVFETKPCIPLEIPGQPVRFSPLESGGRMAWAADGRLLVTFGDHAMDGVNSVIQAPQDDTYSFGKIIAVDVSNGSSEIHSRGHRNPQGLVATAEGLVWSTEHGPEGGDELNLIVKSGNYGWPLATYGTEYGMYSWPLIEGADPDAGFLRPFYSWVPSIGVSSLMELTSPRFERWRGDLLAGSLRDMSFYRLRVREGRVVMTERMVFGQRIRDVLEGFDGSLVVWSDDRSLSFIAPAAVEDIVSAESTFRICGQCHVAPDKGGPPVAPSLVGIVGRAVASQPDYPYSEALRSLGGTWTKERLDAFLADAAGYAPGTAMSSIAIRDDASRKALIEYLASPSHPLDRMPNRRTRIDAPQYQGTP